MEGRGSAILAVVAAMVIVSAMAPGVSAVNHLVGGTNQWDYPPSGNPTYYDGTWVPTQTFRVGDTLQFQYTLNHDVVQYGSKADYDACGGTQVNKWTSGNDTIPLNATGVYWFICSFPGHCPDGMKVSVSVVAAQATPPATPPASPPTTTPSPPAPGTPPPPGTTSPPPPPPGNGATSGPVLSMLGLGVSAVLAACAAFLAV